MSKDVQEALSRGVLEVIDRGHLEERLNSGKKLRIKLGIDPTSPKIHLGRAILLWKLRAFQDLGHTAVFIVGDSTGIIGDTSDKESERPMLSDQEVKTNMKNYLDQALKILDPKKLETHYNSKWLDKLHFKELAQMANLFGLHEFSSREVIRRRLDRGERVSFHEMLYPLLQGYDSVAVKADVELGGSDQRFNLLAGRRIQPLFDLEPQDILMTEILEGLDGRKMSSSWGNTVNIGDEPQEMFGKIMSLRDELTERYFKLTTHVSFEEIEDIMMLHPKEAKMRLAEEIVKLYHGEKAAREAKEDFEKTFSKGGVPDDISTVRAKKGTPLAEIFLNAGIVSSKSEYSRLEKAGAIEEKENGVYRIGKHRFLKIEWD